VEVLVAVVKSPVGRGLASGIAAVVMREAEEKVTVGVGGGGCVAVSAIVAVVMSEAEEEGEKVTLKVVGEGWTAVW
jgi:hypothetical protein